MSVTWQGAVARGARHLGPAEGRARAARRRAWRRAVPPRAAAAVVCALWLVPTVGVLVTSVRSVDDASSTGWWTLFTGADGWDRLTLGNYAEAVDRGNLAAGFVNSLAIALPATFIPVLIATFAAYAFTFMRFPGRHALFLGVVSLLVVPNYVAFVPVIRLYADVHLNGTFPAAWLAHVGFGMPMAVYLLRNYMATLPREIIESAEIDGASHFQTLMLLVAPMSLPALASFAIFQFLWVWNDLLVALVFVGPGENQPITVAANSLVGQMGTGWELVTAGGIMSMTVPVAVFLAMQRYFVRGVAAGAVKG